MNYLDFEKLVNQRQSCRNFSDKPVENEKLEQIISLALLSPSACNSQPWSFDVVNNHLSPEIAKGTQDMGMNKFAEKSPAFIVVCEEKATLSERVGMKFKDTDFVSIDLGIACAHIILAAESLGLSTCVLGWLSQKKLREVLGHSKNKRIRLVIAVGYGGEKNTRRAKKRKPSEQTVRYRF